MNARPDVVVNTWQVLRLCGLPSIYGIATVPTAPCAYNHGKRTTREITVSVPAFNDYLLPVLKHTGDGAEHTVSELTEAMAQALRAHGRGPC